MKSEDEIYLDYVKLQPDCFVVDYNDEIVKEIIKNTINYQSYVLRIKGHELIEAVRLEVYKLFK